MAEDIVPIVRYPNRRFYDRRARKYVSLGDIEATVRAGDKVVIADSQTDEDLTRSVLARIIMERQPDKLKLFPIEMLHFILRSNDVMSGFLRDYFRQSLTYLSYLQQHGATVRSIAQPMHWLKAWMDGNPPMPEVSRAVAGSREGNSVAQSPNSADESLDSTESAKSEAMAERIQQLEERLRRLEQEGSDDEEQ